MDLKSQENVNSTSPEAHKARGTKQAVPHLAYVAMGTVLYGGIWSYIGILKFLSLNAYVFDLGINSERGWEILHTNLGLHGYLTTLINSGIVFPLSPLTGSGNFFAMIIFQAFAIAMVGPALYFIAKEKGLKPKDSMLLSFAFFLYFPVYGIMWFDFHYQVFFMPLFVFAYLLYLRKNYAASALLFILSGTVRYPYSIFPLAFASIEIFLLLRDRHIGFDRRRMTSVALIFTLMFIWTVLGFLILGLSSTIPHSGVSQYTATVSQAWSRVYVILLFLAPLLLLPAVRVRWIFLALPAFFLFLSSNYTWYVYPHVFQGQYTAGVAPFLFLGLVDYLSLKARRQNGRNILITSWKRLFRLRPVRRPIVAILVILLFLNIFFAPFSPLNNQFGDQFNFRQNTASNTQQYSELESMIKMMPPSNEYVAYQNNMPELFPRATPPGGALLMGGYLGGFSNVSVGEASNNSWLVNAGNSKVSMPVDFAIADASNLNFYLAGNSMYSIVHDMYKSGKYGIVSEGYGLILLQRGYIGTVKNYVPENITLPGNSFSSSSGFNNEYINTSVANGSGILGENAGAPLYLFPGQYTVTFYLNLQLTGNASSSSIITLEVYSGSKALLSTPGNVSYENGNPGFAEITFTFPLDGIAGDVWYSLHEPIRAGDMSASKVMVNQTSPFQHYMLN